MDKINTDEVCKVLNEIMEYELAGVVRYTHSSMMVTGPHRIPIVNFLKEQANDMGVNAFEMVQGFSCLYDIQPTQAEVADTIHGHPDQATINDGVDTQILNALAWYALEEVAFNETET